MSLEIKRLNLNKSSILKIERSMHELIDINNTQIIAGKKWVQKIYEAKIVYEILVAVVFNFFSVKCQELPCYYLVVRVMSYLMVVTRK